MRCVSATLLLFSLACSENPLDPDDAIDPVTYLFGDVQPDAGQPQGATCNDVCDKLSFCFDYDYGTCLQECQSLNAQQRQAVVDATCDQLAAELFGE